MDTFRVYQRFVIMFLLGVLLGFGLYKMTLSIVSPVPAPLVDAPWWWNEVRPQWGDAFKLEYDPTGTIPVFKDYSGKGITMRGGQRVVEYAPDADKRLWIFGNSALLGMELPDRYTIPSMLQMLIGSSVRVEDRALSGGDIWALNAYLSVTPIKAGDLVVFVSGGLDSNIDDYMKALNGAREFAESHGAAFSHVIQPCAIQHNCVQYTGLRSRLNGASYSLDLGDLFADRQRVFFESGLHMNDEGSFVVASRIYDYLKGMKQL